ncbi:MAG: peptidylprolyl isomerase [Desulfobacterales bacterium]|nr:peptidylprolyl isomerase [Desulfobacterales bacterium]
MNGLKTWGSLALAVLMVVAADSGAHAAEKAAAKDRVAVVNDTVITRNEFDRELAQFKERIASQGRQIPDAMQEEIENNILDKLIDRELLHQKSLEKKVHIELSVVAEEIKKLKERYPDPAAFDAILKRMNMAENDLQALITKGLAIKTLIEEHATRGIAVTDTESREFYTAHPEYFKRPERVKASHILIKQEAGADEAQKAEARKKIEAVQKRLAKGEDFETLAREVSEGPSAPQGGVLGFFGRGQMVKPFEDAAFALAPGKVSDIVPTRFGLHLIKVMEKAPEETVAYEEAKDQIVLNLTNEKRQKAMEDYLEKLRQAASIKKTL